MFDKQSDIKSFWAYSSILNLPIILISILASTSINTDSSNIHYYTLLMTYLIYYIFFYSTNTFILRIYALYLKPVEEKRWLIGKEYFTSLSNIIQDYSPKSKFNINLVI